MKLITMPIILIIFILVSSPLQAHWLIYHMSFKNPKDTVQELELALRMHDDFVQVRANFALANSRQTAAMIHELNGRVHVSRVLFNQAMKLLKKSADNLESTQANMDDLTIFIQEREPELVDGFEQALVKNAADVIFTDPVNGEVVVSGILSAADGLVAYNKALSLIQQRMSGGLAFQEEAREFIKVGTFASALLSGQLISTEAWENLGKTLSAGSQFFEQIAIATIKAAQEMFPAGFPVQTPVKSPIREGASLGS